MSVALARRVALCLIVTAGWMLVGIPPPAFAATNAVFGGIGGISNGTLLGGDGTGSAKFEIQSVDLALRKQALDLKGIVLPEGSNVAPGEEIFFLLSVGNTTLYSVHDIRISDVLDLTAFTYIPESIEYTVVSNAADDGAIWSSGWIPVTDIQGSPDDIASYQEYEDRPGTALITVGTVPDQANQVLDLPGQSDLLIRFRVRVK